MRTLSRIRVNNKTTKADWLDLILSLKDPNASHIIAMYKEDGKLSQDRDEYLRNNQGQWFKIKSNGVKTNRRIEVIKENRQFVIEYK